MARVMAVLADLPGVPGATVNRYCSSSLQAIRMAAHAVRAGDGDCFVAAGVEMASRFHKGTADRHPDTKNPRFEKAQERSAARREAPPHPGRRPRLPDIYLVDGPHRRERRRPARCRARGDGRARSAAPSSARWPARRTGSSRRDRPGTRRRSVVDRDDGPRPGTTPETLARLSPVFREDGRMTAGNACPLNDGAAAVVVMSESRARQLGIQPLARILSSAVCAVDPEIMGLGPVEASNRALRRAGMTIEDVDRVEMNEAFAAQVIPSARIWVSSGTG